jgi:hypothetical protein
MKPQKAKLKRGFSVGSAVLIGTVTGNSSPQEISPVVTTRNSSTSSAGARIIEDLRRGETDGTRLSIRISPDIAPWAGSDAKRFKALAMKRATESATAEEEQEFRQLQIRRRLFESKASSDDVLNEWQRRRFISQLIDVISRNVTFFRSEDQQRIRALAETKRV